MSVITTIAALQDIHAGISGVTKAPTAIGSYPLSLNTADLPIVLTWPGPAASFETAMNSLRRSDRVYRVQCLIEPNGQTQGLEAHATGAALLQSFIEAYIDPQQFALSTTPSQATIKIGEEYPVRDSGLVVIAYAGIEYRGFQFDVEVYEKW